MLATGACFVAVTAFVKYLDNSVPAAQAAFLRYVLGLVFLIPMIRPMRAVNYTKPMMIQFGVRGFVHSLGVIMWFYAMTRIPIAEVTAMNYLSPVYVTLGASIFFGERLAARRIMAVGIALLGAIVILRPGFRELNDGHLTMLGTAIFFALSYLMAKKFSGEVPASVVVGMLSVTVTIGLAPFAFAVWVTPTLTDIGILFIVACFATLGHLTMTMAFAAAPLTVTQPVTFLQLVWATLLGVVVFGEAVDSFVLFGGGMIIASVSFITWREAQLRRGAVTPAAPQTKG
jgi:drug/metabolite transporter (DMT)-like permease